ncbi:hypothetical protein ACQ4PT_049201 [Festuca glaucescens]
MDGVESYTELLASVAGSGFARVAANDLGTAAAVVHSPCVDPVSNGGSHLAQIHRSSSSSGSDSLSSCGEEDDDPVAVSEPYFPAGSSWEEDDDAVPVQDPYYPAGSSLFSSSGEEDDDAVPVSEPYYPTPIDAVESHDVDQYCAASDTFASQMHNAAAPGEQQKFVPPKSFYIKRKRTAKSTKLPTCRPPSEVGAVEAALRASANKDTAQIFYPKPGTVFDSLAEAYEFYNLFSWEVGFGVRYGRSNINKGNGYKTKQEIECGNASTVLSGGDYLRSKHISGAFVGDHLKYDVQHCRHIIAPVPSSTGFSCYIWDISARDLLVLDPTMMNSTRKNSGLYTMHYARWYAGLGLARSITDVELGEVREDMFYQLLSMTSNVGDLPGLFWRLK